MILIGIIGIVCYGIVLYSVSWMCVNMFDILVLFIVWIVWCVCCMCLVFLLLLIIFSVK